MSVESQEQLQEQRDGVYPPRIRDRYTLENGLMEDIIDTIFGQAGTSPSIEEITGNYTATIGNDFIVNISGDNEISLPALATAERSLTIRSISGSVTISADGAESTEVASINTGQSTTLLPTSLGWFQV